MEQSDNIQSVEDEKVLQWNEEEMKYVFVDGLYKLPGHTEGYTSRGLLEDAWRHKVAEKKIKEALKLQKKSRRISDTSIKGSTRVRMAGKAKKELEKWANP